MLRQSREYGERCSPITTAQTLDRRHGHYSALITCANTQIYEGRAGGDFGTSASADSYGREPVTTPDDPANRVHTNRATSASLDARQSLGFYVSLLAAVRAGLMLAVVDGWRQVLAGAPLPWAGQEPVRESFRDGGALRGVAIVRCFCHDLVVNEEVQVGPAAAPQHQLGIAAGCGGHGHPEGFRVRDQGAVGDDGLRPGSFCVAPGERSDIHAARFPAGTSGAEFCGHCVEVNQPVHLMIIPGLVPSSTRCATPWLRFMRDLP